MQFLTSRTLIYIRAILLLMGAFWIATDPKSLCHLNFILLLGEAMNLPAIPVDESFPGWGMISLLLGSLAISDLIPSLADNIQYFETIVPTRLFGYFVLGTYTYLVEDKVFGNNVIFVYSFMEIWINFLIYNNLRDEKYARLKHYTEEHGEELTREANEQVTVIEEEY